MPVAHYLLSAELFRNRRSILQHLHEEVRGLILPQLNHLLHQLVWLCSILPLYFQQDVCS